MLVDEKIIAGLFTLVGVLLVALANLYWNFRSAKSARKLPFLEKQLEFCFEASQVVSVLATSADPAQWSAARDRFWQLYYGVLSIVEDPQVEACMVNCGRRIPVTGVPSPETLPDDALWEASLELGQAIRNLLFSAWKIRDLGQTLSGRKTALGELRDIYHEEFARQMQKTESKAPGSSKAR